MLNELEKSILKVLCFFDLLEYPLTLMEIWQWLDRPVDLFELQKTLTEAVEKKKLCLASGFYFLNGRQFIVSQRLSRYALSDRKFKKVIGVIKFLKYLPWLRAVAVYGSLSLSNPKAAGDIDLFVIAKSRRLWSCRFFVNLFLKIFRLRPNQKTKKDKICVSYLADEDNLNLSLVNEDERDYYYYYGTGTFLFLYERQNVKEKFFAANNWVKEIAVNSFPHKANNRRRVKAAAFDFWAEKIFWFVPDNFFKKIQLKILPHRFKAVMNQSKKVIISDGLIKLHDNDNHLAVNQQFENNFKTILADASQT